MTGCGDKGKGAAPDGGKKGADHAPHGAGPNGGVVLGTVTGEIDGKPSSGEFKE